MNDNSLGIYIHIPFCLRKCPYCGFYSRAVGYGDEEGCESSFKAYIECAIRDIEVFAERYSAGRVVDSVFFGGGTPTVLSAEDLAEILDAVRRCFKVSSDAEITIESNPGIMNYLSGAIYNHNCETGKYLKCEDGGEAFASTDYYRSLRDAGFNRLSIGVQSFDDEVLRTLGRIHTAQEAKSAFRGARAAGFDNINLDLMFGIPGQTMESWKYTLDKVLDLNPEHISTYSLQIEEETPYYNKFQAGELIELPDELDRTMYHFAIDYFSKSASGEDKPGYKHYEISNFSKPGFECRHNIKYWTLREYLGIGPSTSSYIDGTRFTFVSDLDVWCKGPIKNKLIWNVDNNNIESDTVEENRLSEFHVNSDFDDMSEYTFTGLRMMRGIHYGEFKSHFGVDFREAFSDRWDELTPYFASGAIEQLVDAEGTPSSLRITEQGIDFSNQVMAVFV